MTREYRTRIRIPKLQLPRVEIQQGSLPIPHSPSLRLLRQAMEKAAVEGNGTLDTHYYDCLGEKYNVWLAVHTEGFQRGVGMKIKPDGSVSFEFDDASLAQPSQSPDLIGQARFILDKTEVARELCSRVAKHYAVLAIANSLQEVGCEIELTASEEDKDTQWITIHGRDHRGRIRQLSVGPKAEVKADMIGFEGDDCVAAESKLRKQLEQFGLELEVTSHRRKKGDAPASLQHPLSTARGSSA
jgi:hypothetical protein